MDKNSFPDQYLDQPLDNFDPQVQSSYRQRYWSNDQYWDKPNGPVFLYIGGEGALSEEVVISGEFIISPLCNMYINNFSFMFSLLLFF